VCPGNVVSFTCCTTPWRTCHGSELKREVLDDLQGVLHSTDERTAREQLQRVTRKYEKSAPTLAAWIEENVPESLAVLALPAPHREPLRTTNVLERLNRELKRRTRVATLFPNEAALLRLVTAVLMEISEEWETGKRYVTIETK